jgi:SnoaL-like domain
MFPRRSLIQSLSCALIALCLTTACAKKETVITEQKINAILEEIDAAARNRDIDTIVKHFSKKARITLKIKSSPLVKSESRYVPIDTRWTMTRDEYRDYYKRSMSDIDTFDYRRKDTIIKINADGQMAVVGDQVFETAKMGEADVSSVTEETAVFEIEDGQIVITSLEGTMLWN